MDKSTPIDQSIRIDFPHQKKRRCDSSLRIDDTSATSLTQFFRMALCRQKREQRSRVGYLLCLAHLSHFSEYSYLFDPNQHIFVVFVPKNSVFSVRPNILAKGLISLLPYDISGFFDLRMYYRNRDVRQAIHFLIYLGLYQTAYFNR